MPDINSWFTDKEAAGGWQEDIEGDARSVHFTHRIITAKPTIIEIQRNGQTLEPQTVRIEMTRIQPDVNVGPAARESRANTVLIGYKGHPTIADTDIQVGDVFLLSDRRFRVRLIFAENVGHIEAWLEDLS